MNRLAQFLHCGGKVLGLKRRRRGGRSDRPFARIPTVAVLVSLVLGVVLRVSSYRELSQQTRRRRGQHLCGLQGPLSDDTFDYVTQRLSLEDLRQSLARLNRQLKANKALENRKIGGLLFVGLDANEHFQSRSRCCEGCCQRPIEETAAAGQKHTVTEYYHRYVFAQINGPKFTPVLDLEPIRPGEEECSAALRLLGRLRRVYGPRFFDAITVDAWSVQGPFLRAVEKLGWPWGGLEAGADGSLSGSAAIKPGRAGFELCGRGTQKAGALVGGQRVAFERDLRQTLSGRALGGTLGRDKGPGWHQTAPAAKEPMALGGQ